MPMSGERAVVAGEVAHPPHDDERGDEGADRRRSVHVACSPARSVVEPGDEHVAEAVEQRGEREQRAVGAGREAAGGEVGDEEQAEDDDEERRRGWPAASTVRPSAASE